MNLDLNYHDRQWAQFYVVGIYEPDNPFGLQLSFPFFFCHLLFLKEGKIKEKNEKK